MKKSRERKEQELEAQAKELIGRLLEWDEQHQRPNLTQMEEIVLELRKEMGQGMLEMLVNEQGAANPAEVECEECGQVMRNKGKKVKVVESQIGELGLKRDYYYCPACGSGIFPPRRTVGDQGETLE